MDRANRLAKRGLSRQFTIELTEAWYRHFSNKPVTCKELLDEGATLFLMLRAAGVAEPLFGRSGYELRRVRAWFNYFGHNQHSLPTRDGRDDAWLEVEANEYQDAWVLHMPERRTAALATEEVRTW